MKWIALSAGGGAGVWYVLFNILENLKLPEEYDFVRQIVLAAPVVAGSSLSVHRAHTK